ncbi:hypothetical protein BDL97_16G092800 [Sphagnum fallax]|nr:hypothetical protein BDL97_16G092800 [Sphagnum fallax]
MHIQSHLLGDKCSAGLCGSLSCPEDTMEELRIIVDDTAESPTKRKQEEKMDGGVIKASSKTNCENGTDSRLRMKGKEKITAVEQASIGNGLLFQAKAQPPPGATTAPDLELFFEGFGVRGETIAKVKELGFTSKAFTSNLDELPSIIVSIKQHSCHVTVGEEQGIKCAAKHWQKEENSPVSRVSGDNKGASSSQTEGQSQQTSTGQGIPSVPAGNTHEALFGNQRAKVPENASTDLSRDDCLAMGDLDTVKQYQELKLSSRRYNIPAKTISGNEVVAINGWVPSFGVDKDGHIESISDFDAPFNTSGQGSEENM